MKIFCQMVSLGLLVGHLTYADSAVYPGNLDKPSYLGTDKGKIQGLLIEAYCAYMEALEETRTPKSSLSEQERRDKVAMAQKELVKRVTCILMKSMIPSGLITT